VSRLIIMRHGQTDWNAAARFQGQSDSELDDVGRAQASAAARVLATETPDVIVSSDLKRTVATAAALADMTGLRVRLDARLRERHFGQWQGLLRAEIAERFPAEFARWLKGDPDPGCGIEPLDSVAQRVGAALADAAAGAGDGTVIAVTHGAAARHGLGELLGWPHEHMRQFRGMRNCHWADLTHDPDHGWVLRAYNAGVPAR
jgi:glucosyl-3-phosphoglycerate phosphatase